MEAEKTSESAAITFDVMEAHKNPVEILLGFGGRRRRGGRGVACCPSGRWAVVAGRVERGVVRVGEEIDIVGIRATQKTVVTGVEMFRKGLDEGQAGDNLGGLLRGTKKEDVERGMGLSKPGSITPHTKF